MGVREDRAAKLISLVASGEEGIRFIRDGDTVHVLALPEDRPARHKRLFGDGEGELLMRALLGEEWAVCAAKFVRHAGGYDSGAQLISRFPDERLCRRCHAAFGLEHGHLIFEANQ